MLKYTSVLGSSITVGNISTVTDTILKHIHIGKFGFICIANVHMIITAKSNKNLRTVMKAATITTSDGMPLVWDLKRQGFREADRVSGPDLMLELCERSQGEGVPVYFYGGSISVVEVMQGKLVEHFPNLIVAGIESPPMLPDQPQVDQDVVDKIKSTGAKIVFVGLGCPKQELWMNAYSPHIPAVLIGVGAAFDFFAGTLNRAPLWMQKAGLEWFYRLYSEPRRLWKRYLVTNSLFIGFWLKERLGGPK